MYSSPLSSTSALDGVGWSTSRPGRFTPGKDPVPVVQEVGWAPGSVGTYAENLAPPPPPGFDPRTVQPVLSRPMNPYARITFNFTITRSGQRLGNIRTGKPSDSPAGVATIQCLSLHP